MADTPTKRYSAMNMNCSWRGILPMPDGTVDAGDRATVMFLYAFGGALAGGAGDKVPLLLMMGVGV